MNRMEQRYAEVLTVRQAAGEISLWRFEPLKLRLGHKCFYTPDFYVVNADMELELHEVKGYMEDDARVKLSVAASMYPEFRIMLVKAAKGGGFDVTEVEVAACTS